MYKGDYGMAGLFDSLRNLVRTAGQAGPVEVLERYMEGSHLLPQHEGLARKLASLKLISLETRDGNLFATTTRAGRTCVTPGVARILWEYRQTRPIEGRSDSDTIHQLEQHGLIERSHHSESGSKRRVMHARTTDLGRKFLRTFPRMHEI